MEQYNTEKNKSYIKELNHLEILKEPEDNILQDDLEISETMNMERIQEQSLFAKSKNIANPDELYQELIDTIRSYCPSDNMDIIQRAYEVAQEAHEGITRKSGEPYVTHPLQVGIILANINADKETIAAGILHDVLEDSTFDYEYLKENFSEEIANLVDGVTKVNRHNELPETLENKTEIEKKAAADTHIKMLLHISEDVRVLYIKLADRLHNMKTMDVMDAEKQKIKSWEVWEIYSPLASALGISRMKVQLDDYALKYIMPEKYEEIKNLVRQKKNEREDFIKRIIEKLKGYIAQQNISARVFGRVKHFYSIYKKMQDKHKKIEDIYDLFAVRIVCKGSKENVYDLASIVMGKFHIVENRYKDYIQIPKKNGYQSLHFIAIEDGIRFEIQIRNEEMDKIAELGTAAHWKYKEGAKALKRQWISEIMEVQYEAKQISEDSIKQMETIKETWENSSNEMIFCYSPKKDKYALPKGSTAIDFAYKVHTTLGNTMLGCKINGKAASISKPLQDWDVIEIITSKNGNGGPKSEWEKLCKTSSARVKIRQRIRELTKPENIIIGEEILKQYCEKRGFDKWILSDKEIQKKLLLQFSLSKWEDLLAGVGRRDIQAETILNKVKLKEKESYRPVFKPKSQCSPNQKKEALRIGSVSLDGGISYIKAYLSCCCCPLPGDEIVGFITRGRGIKIHRIDCVNMINLGEEDKKRLCSLSWDEESKNKNDIRYLVKIVLYFEDKIGILNEVAEYFAKKGYNLSNISSQNDKKTGKPISIEFETTIANSEELKSLEKYSYNISGVTAIERKKT